MEGNKTIIAVIKPVKEFINSFDIKTATKIANAIDLLEIFGSKLNMPHSKKIDSEIYELRIRGKKEIRIFYVFIRGEIFLIHGFTKKSNKLPLKEVKIAKLRYRELTL